MAKTKKITKKSTKKNKYTYVHFNFFVDGLSETQASDLYDIMLIFCRNHGVAGSYDMLTDKDMEAINKKDDDEFWMNFGKLPTGKKIELLKQWG